MIRLLCQELKNKENQNLSNRQKNQLKTVIEEKTMSDLQKGKINTDYVVKEKDISSMKTFMTVETSDTANEVAALKDELSDKDAIIAELRKQLAAQKADTKPAAKTVKRKTITKKPAEG